ncbi:MAG TPA: glycosyltransferase family 39 protein [Thermoanaerobaculia bacterium]
MSEPAPVEVFGARTRRRAVLAGILGVGAFVRLYRLDLTWYFLDQVRDVSTGTAIASGQSFPLLGPLIGWTRGQLGPLYFYLIAPSFLLSGSPLAGVVFAALAGVLTIFLVYRFASEVFGPPVALAAAALFAVFPLAVLSSRVLWNPAFIPLFTVLFMRDLYAVVAGGRSRSIIGVFAWLAVLTQLHLTGALLGVVALLSLLVWRPRLKLSHVLAGSAVSLALYVPYLVHELGHRFANTRVLLEAVTSGEGWGGERGILAVLKNLLVLDRGVLDGFVLRDSWSPGFLRAFSILYASEAVLFGIGLALCVTRLLRGAAATEETRGSRTAGRRPVGLLLLWLLVPVVLLGSRKTALWWYYFDVLYPSQLIIASIALAWLAAPGFAPAVARRYLARGTAAVVLALVAVQTCFQVGLQRRIDAQAELLFDTPRFSVASTGTSIHVLTSLPYSYRNRILQVLVEDFGLAEDAFGRRVHGPVLGLPEENAYLLHRLAARAPAKRPEDGAATHYLVVKAPSAAPPSAFRTARVGPYVISAYRPAIDYGSWSYALMPRATWERRGLPADNLPALGAGQGQAWRGAIRIPHGGPAVRVAVVLTGAAPLEVTRAEARGGSVMRLGQRSWQGPSLYWTTETIFDVSAAAGVDPVSFLFMVGCSGSVVRIDVNELAAPAPPFSDP